MDFALASCGMAVGASVFAGSFVCLMPSFEGESRRGEVTWGGRLERLSEAVEKLPPVRALRESSLRSARRSAALRDMPTMLDVVTLGLSAGLSFDASLELYCQRYRTGLSDAFGEALLSWRMGAMPRDEALDQLADQLDVTALRRFAGAVSQALAFGAPLAETLEQQAQAIRDEQRSEMEAEIERVPVKMLVPLGTLIVPAMLLSIMGPLLGPSVAFM